MTSMNRKLDSFRRLIAVLRERCPAMVPVHVRRMKVPADRMGDCSPVWDEKGRLVRFVIRIDKSLNWETTWHVLIHEWAHAVSWVDGHETVDDHDEMWGIAYARCWRETE